MKRVDKIKAEVKADYPFATELEIEKITKIRLGEKT